MCAPSPAPGRPDTKHAGSSVTPALTETLNTRGMYLLWLTADRSKHISPQNEVNGASKAGKFCHNFLPRHSRDNKRPPATSIYNFQGGWGCNNRRWWRAGINGISLLSPASSVMVVLESWPAAPDWGYKRKEIWVSLNEITIHGSCQRTSHIASCWGASQE